MAPKFTRTTIPEKESLGEKLAKKRAALGYDIKEAERATKIRAKYLEALESGGYDKLPPDVFVLGFLKNYSAFLKLDQDKVIKLYRKEKGLAENVKKIVTSAPEKNPKNKKSSKIIITPQKIVVGSIVLGFLALFLYIGWQVSLLTAPPKLEVKAPADNIKIQSESTVVEGKTDPGAEVFINDVPISVDPEGNFSEKVSLQSGVNQIGISAKNKLNRVTRISRTVLAELKTLTANASEPKALEMKIDVGPNSDAIYIEVDGRPLSEENILMLPGSSQLIRASEKITITASDGGSLRITLNGKDLGTLGKDGEKVEKKEFNLESI